MKVFKIKAKHKAYAPNDARKSVGIATALNTLSVQERHDKPVTRVKLNIKGDRRGMHMQENPPDSEEMRRRRAMRKLWNKTMPALHCSNCQFSAQCPQFKAGYECAFLPFLNSHSVENEADLLFYAKELCGENVKRAQLMLLMERLSGAKPDIDTSEALSHVFSQLMMLHQRMTESSETSLEIESTDGSIIGRLFGGLDKLIGTTRSMHSTELQMPTVAAELVLDRPKNEGEPKRTANSELVRDLSTVRSGGVEQAPVFTVAPVSQAHNKGPVQEEL